MISENSARLSPHSCLVAKARLCDSFDDRCQEIVEQLFVRRLQFSRHQTFLHEGDEISTIYLMCHGWAARVIDLADGHRQITELFLPGDLFPVHATMSKGTSGDSIVALGDCQISTCSPEKLSQAAVQNSDMARTLWWLSKRDVSILRMWIAVNSQYQAHQRLAHLACEVIYRLRQVGLDADQMEFPLTQEEIGEIIGATSVHVNRSIKRLRNDALLDFPNGRIDIPNLERLEDTAHFDSAYLFPN